MKTFKNVKSITGKVTFHGNGFINGDDSKSQSFVLRDLGLTKGRVYDNVALHKKEFVPYVDENGNNAVGFKYKVSANCIRHIMFADELAYANTSIIQLPQVLYNAIASKALITRGYLFTNKDELSIKKKSSFCITDAVSTSPIMKTVITEVGTRAGFKRSKDVEVDEYGVVTESNGDTTFYKTECVGEHDYMSKLSINLSELQFIPVDTVFDRCCANLGDMDNLTIYTDALVRNLGCKDPVLKPYFLKTSVVGDEYAENGILLDRVVVDSLVKDVITKIVASQETRPSKGGMFVFKSMELTVNMSDGSEETITINNRSDIDKYNFEYDQVYIEANQSRIDARNNLLAELNGNNKNEGKGKGRASKNKKK